MDNLKEHIAQPEDLTLHEPQNVEEPPAPTAPTSYRLFGAHMNSVVTYQDATTAWLVSDDFLSRVSTGVYQRFAGGAHLAGTRIVRGYVDPSKKAEIKDTKEAGPTNSTQEKAEALADELGESDVGFRGRSAPGDSESEAPSELGSETRKRSLERQMSSLVARTTPNDAQQQEEEERKRDEKEIQDDYRGQLGDEQGREIEHLLLVTHGIGQRLGLRTESVNFIHDVNTLRKTLKSVYNTSPDLQALNSEVDKLPKNSRVQVLPIVWRHLLDFPKQSLKHNREEYDLGEKGSGEEEDYPNLDDITVEGVPAVRNLITDLALDILLYQSPAYKDHITRIVLSECNRIYRLFLERQPDFKGKVSLIGHSLGSAIVFDILCRQKDNKEIHGLKRSSKDKEHTLDFDVEHCYCLGSPIGLFQMLSGRKIAARQHPSTVPAQASFGVREDPFLDAASPTKPSAGATASTYVDITVSSPKCASLYNIFHPTDPISYRIEPLISPAMATLKPQPLPYTKKGIFDAPIGQGLTGISTRVGQSVSGLWSSFSSGIASSLLNRSLGISGEDAGKLGIPITDKDKARHSSNSLSLGAGTNIVAGGAISSELSKAQTDVRKENLATEDYVADDVGNHPPTLLDTEIETLYSGFEKRRKSMHSDSEDRDLGESPVWADVEERGRKLKREESKVKALNASGRVDFSIQE